VAPHHQYLLPSCTNVYSYPLNIYSPRKKVPLFFFSSSLLLHNHRSQHTSAGGPRMSNELSRRRSSLAVVGRARWQSSPPSTPAGRSLSGRPSPSTPRHRLPSPHPLSLTHSGRRCPVLMRAGAGADSTGRCGFRRASSPSSSARPWKILGGSVGGTSPPWQHPLLLPSGTMARQISRVVRP
jgi:hypothetical protein